MNNLLSNHLLSSSLNQNHPIIPVDKNKRSILSNHPTLKSSEKTSFKHSNPYQTRSNSQQHTTPHPTAQKSSQKSLHNFTKDVKKVKNIITP